MTIEKMIDDLKKCAEHCGMDAEVKGYVGMSAEVARKRLSKLSAPDEYVYDDFLDVKYLTIYRDGFAYISLEDVEE